MNYSKPFLYLVLLTTFAQAQTAPPLESVPKIDLLQILQQGGVMMYPLAFLSVLTLFLIILYFLIMKKNSVVNNRFMAQAENMILQGDYHNLSEMCDRQSSSVAKVLGRAVDFLRTTPTASLEDVREVAAAEGSRQSGILLQRITYLADVGSVAPMVGLLGTVIGMIKSFMQIAQGNVDGVKQMQLAGAVSEALVTTASGLIIGIVAIIFYSIFRGRVQRYISELEAACTHLMAVMSSMKKRQDNKKKETELLKPRTPDPLFPGSL